MTWEGRKREKKEKEKERKKASKQAIHLRPSAAKQQPKGRWTMDGAGHAQEQGSQVPLASSSTPATVALKQARVPASHRARGRCPELTGPINQDPALPVLEAEQPR